MDSFYIYVYFMSYQEAQKLFDLYTIEEKRNFLELFLSISFSSLAEKPTYQYFLAIHWQELEGIKWVI